MATAGLSHADQGRLLTHYPTYAQHCLKIRTKSGSVEPFLLNDAQQYLHDRMEQQLSLTGRVRLVVLKGRQQGCSTFVEGRYYWIAANRKGQRAFILTHEAEATANLLDMVDRYHRHIPVWAARPLERSSARELEFADLDSGYRIGTAGNKGAGRSNTVQLFHGSEVAFWPNADKHLAGVLQAVPDEPGTEVVLESTANGVGGVFYDYVMDARAGRGDFELVFIPWYWQSEYTSAVPDDFELTAQEQELKQLYSLTDGQLCWRRKKIYELKSEDLFKQEYPCNVDEAFLFSGRPRFDPNHTQAAAMECYKPRFNCQLSTTGINRKQPGKLLVWEPPKTGERYAIGSDVAEGLVHGDYSVIDVCDSSGYQVAHWRGHVEPDALGEMINHLGRWYNTALVGVERNNHGLTTITKLKELKYPNQYNETHVDQRTQKQTKRIGWLSTTKSKPLAIDHLAALLRDGQAGIFCLDTVQECQTYVVEDNGSTNAQEGCFDDRVMSYAIAQQMVLRLAKVKVIVQDKGYQSVNRAGY
ncbi:hypothetical protein [Endozoicomonas sp. Mp262]|uniref:hypothetical protein n=1 Tax=Endozoicomonas sp. Mp262 TaxID=2919499 RepID=UPI0021DAAEC5